MPDPLEIRRVSYDCPAVQELTRAAQEYYIRVYGGPDTDPLTAAEFAAPHGGFLLGYRGGLAAAMGGWRRFVGPPPIPSLRPGEIRRMFVREDLRRQGIARALLAAVEEDARAAGIDALFLTTGRPQMEAVALYRAAGYGDVPRFGHYATASGAVHLGKRLAQPAG